MSRWCQRGAERGQTESVGGGGRDQADTHIGFAEGHVYNAAHYDERVKRVPGVTEIPLHRAGRGRRL